ncbi:MAG TPA: DUF2723 domain-containing protein [Chitinophagaceae bacterium]|nr:DUF2723 domain-containing protein [Chitinophagaceae bacterium]
MNFRKINNITGWIIGVLACAVYFISREATGSFWDCGEFVSSAYKLQLPHPPGAPLFVLLGRFFIILFGNSPNTAAHAVNMMSAFASGFTILFLFWTITHFARKMFVTVGEEMTSQQIFTVMSAGVVGALAYCFSDSFWFSAVEGEVYGLSSFFTGLTFWAMLKWEHADERAGNDQAARSRADRWIVFIFFMMGLSIGVHLLGLLTIPAIGMIYYFRRYQYKLWGAIAAFLISCLITGLVQVVIIKYSMKAAGMMDIFAVNGFHLPFFSGFAFYFIAIAIMVAIGLRFKPNKITKLQMSIWVGVFLVLLLLPFVTKTDSSAARIFKVFLLLGAGFLVYLLKINNTKGLKLALWCYAFMMLGYSTYFTTLIRSNANPSIDMNNVDNPMNLVYYLSREQYGEAPLVYGPHYVAHVKEDPDNPGRYAFKEGEMKYVKGKDKYIPIGKQREYEYEESDMQLFPRIWDGTNDQGHAQFYADWLNLVQRDEKGNAVGYDPPSYGDNMQWFFTYQMGLMYWRYFMWNFAGKQNDVQGFGNVRDGNWITGISFIDNQMLGDQSRMPESSKKNKAHNQLFLLPFMLGILGCVYQFLRDRKDWIDNFLLFFMTGIAVVLYLNQPGNQPRERDYAYVGSFYAFAVWIGLAVPAIFKLVTEKDNLPTGQAGKKLFTNILVFGGILTLLIGLMSYAWHGKQAFPASLMITALYVIFTAIVVQGIRALSSAGQNFKLVNIAATAVCIITPIIMAQQEWDDHDRSKKRLASDVARDYLESCDKNAILFTFGDNDTYPLWYAQEVEGVRPDIRIINNSLLGIDWYINQLRYKVNQSDPIDVIWTPEQIEGENRNYIYYQPDPSKSEDTFYPLYQTVKDVWGKPVLDEDGRDVGPQTFSERKFTVPVDTAFVRRNGTVNADDTVLSQLRFEVPMQGNRLIIQKNDLTILNIIAANNWKRPIYFTSPYTNLGFGSYLRKDGLTYRLVPVVTQRPQDKWIINQRVGLLQNMNVDVAAKNLMDKFVYTSKPGVYFDEENRHHALSIRSTYAEAAGDKADKGKKDDGMKLLNKCESMIDSKDLPYAMISRGSSHNIYGLLYLEACYKVGNMQFAEKVNQALKKDIQQQRSYYNYLKDERDDLFSTLEDEARNNEIMLMILDDIEKQYTQKTQTNPPVEGKNPTIITNIKDSNKGKDTNRK